MLLAIDIGNTSTVLGLFSNRKLVSHWRISTEQRRLPDEYTVLLTSLLTHAGHRPEQISGVVIASVVPALTGVFDATCRACFGQRPLIVDVGVKTGVRIRYDNPRDVGADRVANAVAVLHLYGGPACVVDFSTATIFDAISRDGEYLGGAIAPGIMISAEALFTYAARLPQVDLALPPRAIGTNTIHSLQSGLIFGYIGLVEGIVARFRKELGDDMKTIATGYLAESILKETRAIQIVNPWLTLEGLQIIYEMNK